MRNWLCGLALFLSAGAADAWAQGLPASVEEPYAEYLAAVEREDHEAASRAALQAWRAGQVADLSVDERSALAINALSATDAAGRWRVLAYDGLEIGAALEADGMFRDAMYSYTRARSASTVIRDALQEQRVFEAGMRLSFQRRGDHGSGLDDFMDHLAEKDRAAIEAMPEPRPVLDVVADASASPDDIVNAVVLAVEPLSTLTAEERITTVDRAVSVLIQRDAANEERLNLLFRQGALALAESRADGNGALSFSPGNREAWCAYMRRHPVFARQVLESQYPTRALERGIHQGVLQIRFSASAGGGEITIPQAEGLSREEGYFRRQLVRVLRDEEIRPQCDTTADDVTFRLTEAFAVVEGQRVRGGVQFAAMVQRHVVAD